MIGKFAALSVSNVANINSYYNGKKYSYLMYKNGTGINIDQLNVEKTDSKNGVEVSITTDDVRNLSDALRNLAFFDKLHLELSNVQLYYIEDFNNRKTLRKNKYCLSDKHGWGSKALVGNVLYPLNTRVQEISSCHIIPRFEVGELDITPNREQIQYTSKSEAIIEKRCQEALQEFKKDCIETFKGRVYNDLNEIVDDFYNKSVIYPFKDFSANVERDSLFDLCELNCNGEIVPKSLLHHLGTRRYFTIDKKHYHFSSRKGTDSMAYSFLEFFKHPIYIQIDDRLKAVTKEYFDSINDNRYIIIKPCYLRELARMVFDNLGCDRTTVRFVLKYFKINKISNGLVPSTYVEAHEAKKKALKTSNAKDKIIQDMKDLRITYRQYSGGTYIVCSSRLSNFLARRETVLYGVNTRDDEAYRKVSSIIGYEHYITVITVSKEHAHLLENNKNFIPMDCYLALRQKPIVNWATRCYIAEQLLNNKETSKLPEPLKYVARNAASYEIDFDNAKGFAYDLYSTYKKKRWLDYDKIHKVLPSKEQVLVYIVKQTLQANKDVIINRMLAKHFKTTRVVENYKPIDIEKLINNKIKEYESNQST